jgi:hypothetical protein
MRARGKVTKRKFHVILAIEYNIITFFYINNFLHAHLDPSCSLENPPKFLVFHISYKSRKHLQSYALRVVFCGLWGWLLSNLTVKFSIIVSVCVDSLVN